jgi:RimJ/RimL family protein N-acetyltransferase
MDIIKAKKFILRTPQKSDAADIAKNINNIKIVRNLAVVPFPYKLKDAKLYIDKMLRTMTKEKPTDYVMYIVIDNEVVGAVGAHHIEYGHKAEIGYWLGEKHWGKGIMSEAVKKFIPLVTKKFKLRRVAAKAFSYNPASMRILEKVGMKFEGVLKKEALKNGKYIDSHLYAKIR